MSWPITNSVIADRSDSRSRIATGQRTAHTIDMDTHSTYVEHHYVQRVGWLRAAVLGANDGIISTASLIIGVAAASAGRPEVIIAGIAALVAGSMSMAAGEYVSVSAQADTEKADIETERKALAAAPEEELQELADIYEARGLDADLAMTVAKQLTEKDALGAHLRDELQLSDTLSARPLVAAGSSAISFAIGAAIPLIAAAMTRFETITMTTVIVSLMALALLGIVSAIAGGAGKSRAALRVVFWGSVAMAVTWVIGRAVGSVF